MFLVPTRLGQSAIHGLGVFTLIPIARGTPVWRFVPPFDQEFELSEIEQLDPHVRAFFDHFGYVCRYSKKLVLCFDNGRFVNHSDTPNMGMEREDDPHGIDVALRDIEAGEELTSNYEDFEEGGRSVTLSAPRDAA